MLVCQRVSHVSKSRDSVLGLWKATISTAVRPTSCTIPVTNCYVSMGVNLLCLLGSMKHTNLTAESSISRMGFVKALSLKKAINGSQGRANLQGISLQNRAIYAALLWVQYLHLGSWNSHGKSTIFGVFFFCLHACLKRVQFAWVYMECPAGNGMDLYSGYSGPPNHRCLSLATCKPTSIPIS